MTRVNTSLHARKHREQLASRSSYSTHSTRPKLAPLAEVLAYRHRDVVRRFLETYPIDPADAEQIFTEVKRWLWLSAYRSMLRSRKRLLVTPPMAALDEMWHFFVLFTEDYADFCHRFFGQFIHHRPLTLSEKTRMRRRMREDPEGFAGALARRMEWQYRVIGEILGEETLRRWYIELPAKYPRKTLQRLNAQSAVIGQDD